jgi:MSHA biogenesis protein MshP
MIFMRVNNQKGFTLVQAVFILVVLGLLGVAMVRLIGVQTSTGVMALQGARAYHAARSGLEWGAAQAGTGGCAGSMVIDNVNVTVSCSSESFTEGPIGPYSIHRIQSVAEYGSYGSTDYVSRRVEMRVGLP